MEEVRTEEDKIIEIIKIEANNALYEDSDFIPNQQSLYETEGFIPFYDNDVAKNIVWRRPKDIAAAPEYFTESYDAPFVIQGTLADEVFAGVLMAVCAYRGEPLMENIIFSNPDDFKNYGVYTCRFYVEGEWVEVITDTRIPCIHNEATNKYHPLYSRSPIAKEMWIPLVEKAYAKALGSYEAIAKVRVHEALMHLTGGSVQEHRFSDEMLTDCRPVGRKIKQLLSQNTLIIARPNEIDTLTDTKIEEESHSVHDVDEGKDGLEGLIPDRMYSVVYYKEKGVHELVLLRCPWIRDNVVWEGDWSDTSSKWDEFPDVLQAVQEDKNVKWRRNAPNGYMWMALRQFVRLFQGLFCCRLFSPSQTSYYCCKGEWTDRLAGGPMVTVGERDVRMKAALKSEQQAIQKASASVVIDGDVNWSNNPQYRITCTTNTTIHVSLTPVNIGADNGDDLSLPMVGMHIVTPTTKNERQFIGDSCVCHVVATEKVEGVHRTKGQEAAIWGVSLNPANTYFIIPNTARKGQKCGFVLRIFASDPVEVVTVKPRIYQSISGEWVRTPNTDSTGGPLHILMDDHRKVENSKWCQNPQYLLTINDAFAKDELYLKIAVRRTDRNAAGGKQTMVSGLTDRPDPTIGFVVCKPVPAEEQAAKNKRAGQPRMNALGEIISSKPSSLTKKQNFTSSGSVRPPETANNVKSVRRMLSINPLYYWQATTFCSKTDACIYYPRLPRSWLPDGLLIIPCLSEKGARGTFDIEVTCSENFTLQQLPESRSKSVAGEWTEGLAGGSHICPSWKKNPRFQLDIMTLPGNHHQPPNIRISLSRCGSVWRNLCRSDAVGCMIGFYIFSIGEGGETRQIYESTFVPAEEVCTESGFSLTALSYDKSFIIMPATFGEGKVGSFVLSVSADCDFTLAKESTATHK